MDFDQVKEFLVSWGLSFDTEDGFSTNLAYPQPYQKMRDDAIKVYGETFSKFIGSITDTIDGQSYLAYKSWEEIQEAWEAYKK